MSDKKPKCAICGKFVSYNDIPDKVKVEFIPDTQFTVEEVRFIHKKCEPCQK